MDKKNTVTIRLTDEQFGWLRALSRRSKRSQSEVVRSLIEHGTVRERITRENLDIIRNLLGDCPAFIGHTIKTVSVGSFGKLVQVCAFSNQFSDDR